MCNFCRLARVLCIACPLVMLSGIAGAQDSKSDGKSPTPPAADSKAGGAKSGDGKSEARAVPPARAELDRPAPDFELKGTDGKTYKLSDLKDKTVVIEWFNKDCPTCKHQAAQVRETSEALAKQGVIWLAIDSTGKRKFEDNVEHVKRDKLPHPILDDSAGNVGRTYEVRKTPTLFIVHKGSLAYRGAMIAARGEERNYVKEVAEAVVAGKAPPIKETQAYG
jgi:peroxiredoxin